MRRADGWDRRVRFLLAVVAATARPFLMALDELNGEPDWNRIGPGEAPRRGLLLCSR
jgi:hypothetical protein